MAVFKVLAPPARTEEEANTKICPSRPLTRDAELYSGYCVGNECQAWLQDEADLTRGHCALVLAAYGAMK